jgi:hypothetical protein
VYLAADSTPTQPWWLIAAGIVGTILVAYIAARGPVWLEKVRARHQTHTPAQKVAGAEEVLREWLHQALKERDRALKEVERLNKRIDNLEQELWRRGWDGRSA